MSSQAPRLGITPLMRRCATFAYAWQLRWALLCLFLATGYPARSATFAVNIRVLHNGKPVPNANASLSWQVKSGAMTPDDDKQVVSDQNGMAVLQVDDWNEIRPVLLLSDDRKLGVVLGVSKADDGKVVTAELVPTVQVKGRLDCPELKAKPEWANTMVNLDGIRGRFVQDMGKSAQFDFVLPAGKYTLHSYGSDVDSVNQTVTLKATEPEFDVGTVNLPASVLAKLKGKPAPRWSVTDVRGINSKTTLSDYKGKWVFLEFWGFW